MFMPHEMYMGYEAATLNHTKRGTQKVLFYHTSSQHLANWLIWKTPQCSRHIQWEVLIALQYLWKGSGFATHCKLEHSQYIIKIPLLSLAIKSNLKPYSLQGIHMLYYWPLCPVHPFVHCTLLPINLCTILYFVGSAPFSSLAFVPFMLLPLCYL